MQIVFTVYSFTKIHVIITVVVDNVVTNIRPTAVGRKPNLLFIHFLRTCYCSAYNEIKIHHKWVLLCVFHFMM